MSDHKYSILFICWPNAARSIMAEAILNRLDPNRFKGFSAGVRPDERLHPETSRLLTVLGYDTAPLHPKAWDEYAGGPPMDFVFTLCDDAAGERCPTWPGKPMTAHWGIPNPASATGKTAEVAQAFNQAYHYISRRIDAFTALPLAALDRLTLDAKIREIGRSEGATPMALGQS